MTEFVNVTCTVVIGRNVGDVPMSDGDWQQFRHIVRNVVAGRFPHYVSQGVGVGSWDGGEETNAITVGSASFPTSTSGDYRRQEAEGNVRESLAYWCEEFNQEAIAVTFGATRLVGLEG